MEHAVALSGEEDDQALQTTILSDIESTVVQPTMFEPLKYALSYTWLGIKYLFHLLNPATISAGYHRFRQMTYKDLIKNLFLILIKSIRILFIIIMCALRYINDCDLKA